MILPRYPVYIPSKGRPGKASKTARLFQRDGVPFRVVVEPHEYDAYAAALGEDVLLKLPFQDLGQGSIPARNWILDHAQTHCGAVGRHWVLDDNIGLFYRRFRGVRIPCVAGPAMAAVEDFCDRFENVAIAGMSYMTFCIEGDRVPPFAVNRHVYSCMLVDHGRPIRWRGRYNEDTDLCLQALSLGLCTVLFNAFLVDKTQTMTMKGGNSDQLYRGDGRLAMAKALARQWPRVVRVSRRFDRPQHIVDWTKFRTPLKLRAGVDLASLPASEYGLSLNEKRPPKSDHVATFYTEAMRNR